MVSPPQIWCLGNESRFHINQSVEGTVLATVLRGLVPGVPYHAEVAAATGAGVGIRSAPVPIRIGESLITHGWKVVEVTSVVGMAPGYLHQCVPLFPMSPAALPVERDAGLVRGSNMAERLAEVAKQPAFIAGVGGACWVILAAFATWLYGRRRRKKELSHFTGTWGGVSPLGPTTLPGGSQDPSTPHPTTRPPTVFLLTASFAYTPTGKSISAMGTRRGPSPPSSSPLSTVTFPTPVRGSPR